MPFTTIGTFERLHNWEEDRLNGIEIVTDHHDAEDDNFADGLSQTLLKDGRAPMEGNLNMGGFAITGLARGVNEQDAVTKGQLDEIDLDFVPKNKDCEIGGTKKFLSPVYMPTVSIYCEGEEGVNAEFIKNKLDHEFIIRQLDYLSRSFPNYQDISNISSNFTTTSFGYVLFELPARMVGFIQVGEYSKSFSYNYNNTQPMLITLPVAKDVVVKFSGCTAKFLPIS